MKITRLFVAVVIGALCLPAYAADNSQPIIGTWYGVGQPGFPDMMWMERWSKDGSVIIKVRLCRNGAAIDDTSSGTWKVTGSQEFIVFEDKGRRTEDTYEITFEPGPVLKEVMTASNRPQSPIGFVWRSQKVADNFELPGCNAVS